MVMVQGTEIIDAIVAASLAVNKYPLERSWNLLPKLREQQLTDPAFVASLDVGELKEKLIAIGYDRGKLTPMLAGRFKDLMTDIVAGVLSELPKAISENNKQVAIEILCKVRGIGPMAAGNVVMLLLE
jgi:hypothetical protein